MKTLILTVSLLASSFAFAECLGEAQIIAKVDRIIARDMATGCVVSVKDVEQFNSSYVCPLSLAEVEEIGVQVGLSNGHDCTLNPDDVLTGVLVKTEYGEIILE